tara:strand:+ start:47 stop:733 length:687 start_codon:yes stop_codon:yes gene_type:complete
MSGWNESKKILLKEISFKDKVVLDVGCGNGWFSRWASKNGSQVDAIDPSEGQINDAKSKDYNNKVNFIKAGAENINDLTNVYNLIFFFNSLHHIPVDIMERSIECCKNKIINTGSILIIEPIAEGNFHNFVKNIDDETKVRNEAYKVINKCEKYNLEIIKEVIYNEVKAFNSGDDCINFLSKVDENRMSYIENNKEFLLNEFNNLSNYSNSIYKFIQPMRLNILKNKI